MSQGDDDGIPPARPTTVSKFEHGSEDRGGGVVGGGAPSREVKDGRGNGRQEPDGEADG